MGYESKHWYAVTIKFKEHIKVVEAYHLYSLLSMIAEVGGYVGLFLGISVNQISALVNVVVDRFDWIYNRKKISEILD